MPPKKFAKIAAGKARATPKAGELTEVTKTVRAQKGPAPIVVCVFKYSDAAKDLWPAIEDPTAALFQIQIRHDGRPSITHDIFSSINKYLREASVDNAELPTSVGDLAARAGIRVVLTNAEDPDGAGCFVHYRVALYVAGHEEALHNAMIMLDDFFLWKQRQMARERPFDVHVHPYVGVSLDTAGIESCNYTFNDASIRPPLGVFQAHPVYGKRIVALHVEPLGVDVVSVLIGGRIWSYRDRLDAYDVPGVSYRPSAGVSKVYYRVLQQVVVTDECQRLRVLSLFPKVFKNLAIRLSVVSAPETASPAAAFIEQLRALRCMHET